jgi:hypothetical protein
MGVLQQNGFEVAVEEDQPAGRRLKLVAQPVSKNTEFDTQGALRVLRHFPASELAVHRSGGDPAPSQGSARGNARAFVEDTCDVCDARVSQEHDGRRAAKRQADDDRESSSQLTPRLLSATIYSFSQRTHIDGSTRLFDTWDRWNNRGIARMAGQR